MKTLFFGLNWIGDVVMSFPALALAAEQDGNTVDVLTRPALEPVYSLLPGVGNVILADTRKPAWNLLSEIALVRKHRYDRIIILPRSFRTALLGFLCGGRRRRGFPGEGRSPFLNDAAQLPAWADKIHESRLHLALVQASAPNSPPPAGPASMPELKCSHQSAAAILERLQLGTSNRYAVIAPGAAFGEIKRWHAERFAALGVHLRDRHGLRILVSGSASEATLTSKVVSEIGAGAFDLAGHTSLHELFDLLAGASLLACNDSGTMHLGAALKTPLLVPVGPTDMNRTGPMSDRASIVRGLPCPDGVPCRRRECRHGTRICMESVSVKDVTQSADNLLTGCCEQIPQGDRCRIISPATGQSEGQRK